MSLSWQSLLGGLSGCFAVGASAYGAHGLKSKKESFSKTFDTGARLQLLHSALLVATPSIHRYSKSSAANVSGALLSVGILLFSGSCYAVGLTEDRSYGKAAPVGGVTLMAAWLSLGLARR